MAASTQQLQTTPPATSVLFPITSSSVNQPATIAGATGEQGLNIQVLGDIMKWIYLAVAILGILCNGFVIYVIGRSRALQQQPRNWLILNQSVADLLSAIFLITVVTRANSTNLSGASGWWTCTVWNSNALLWICYVSSEYILLLLTCEVYLAIVYPVRHINTITTARLMVAVGVIWLCSAIFTLSYNMATCQIVNGVCFVGRVWVTPAAQPAYFTINFFIKLFFPVSVFAFCYTGMAVSLRTNKVTAETPSNHQLAIGGESVGVGKADSAASRSVYMRARRNIYYTLSYTLALHIITWSGNQIQVLLFGFGLPTVNANSLSFHIPLLAIYASGFVNPIVYMIKYERFRQAVRTLFHTTKNHGNAH